MTRLLTILLLVAPAYAEWSEPVEVRMGDELCVTYQSRLAGDRLVVRATPAEGWHTFTMDNERRAKEALNGKMSLGVDAPTTFELGPGLEVAGEWRQSPPKDFSKPDLRWYSWGYEQPAAFVVEVKKAAGKATTTIGVRGQACDATRCKNIDVEWEQALNADDGPLDLDDLIPVKR